MSDQPLFVFPSSPNAAAIEWPGTPIGVSNTITRTKGRTAVHDKTIDRTPGKRDALVASVEKHMAAHPDERVYQHDVVIHGIRVRAQTNSAHLFDFWVTNWFGVDEWLEITGQTPSADPQVMVYAFGGVESEPEAAYYSRATNTVIFFNTSYYGQLKSWVLGAVGRVLAEVYGIHSVHGACVEKNARGILYIAPTGTGKSTSSYGLMDYPNTRFHSDDWVYIRYTVATRDGRRIAPVTIHDGAAEIHGYHCFRWLETNASRKDARINALTLDNTPLDLTVGELDFSKPREAYAYTSEKVFYLRSNIVENFPLAACELLHSTFENVPDLTPPFREQFARLMRTSADAALAADAQAGCGFLAEQPRAMVEEQMGRLAAFDNARAMLRIENVFAAARCYVNPLEPVKVRTVFLLKRNFGQDDVLESLDQAQFLTRLMIGLTPDGKKETAYNAYRAVDDAEERAFINALEQESESRRVPLYDLYRASRNIPETLYEEFELFRVLHSATRDYHLNTILTKDPRNTTKAEAVRETMELIAQTADREPRDVSLTIQDYRGLIA
ncbi:MAG: hypothetical protein HY782_27420 [Chloroflexi bacterium]|nr:hypothetical protein [Chloroflexota bacterium]